MRAEYGQKVTSKWIKCACCVLLLFASSKIVQAEVVLGRVVDAVSGGVLPSATVRILPLGDPIETDDAGLFATANLGRGIHSIEVSKSGYSSQVLRIQMPDSSLTGGMVVRLIPHGVISGRVLDVQGRPQVGARVSALRSRQAASGLVATDARATVDDRGQYRLYGLPPGDYVVALRYDFAESGTGVEVSPRGPYTDPGSTLRITRGEQHKDVDFVLRPDRPHSIVGTIQAPTAGGLDRFSVSLVSTEIPTLVISSQTVEATGSFRFERVRRGSYDVVVLGPEVGSARDGAVLGKRPLFGRVRVLVAGESQDQLAVPMAEGHSATFTLRTLGDPGNVCPKKAQGRLVPLIAWPVYLPQGTFELNSDGFTASALPPGPYSISVTGLGDRCYVRGFVVDDAPVHESSIDLLRNGSRIAVIVSSLTSAISGQIAFPAEATWGWPVALWPVEVAQSDSPPSTIVATSDRAGQFAFAEILPGLYRLAVASGQGIFPDAERFTEIRIRAGEKVSVQLSPLPADVERQKERIE